MPTNFPGSLDDFTAAKPGPTSFEDDVGKFHDEVHVDEMDATAALEAKVGADLSADPTSLDYRIRRVEATLYPFTASLGGGSSHEHGESVASVALSWSYSDTISAQSLSGPGSSPPALGDRAQTVSGPFTTGQAWTITGTASDAVTHSSSSTSLSFYDKRYWGVSAQSTLNDAQIIALSSELATGRAQTRSLSPSAQYLYFAWPSSFGTPVFTVNGLTNTDWQLVTRAFVNAHGYSVSYDIYRSTFLQNSPVTVGVA